jgi:hypothetical protein
VPHLSTLNAPATRPAMNGTGPDRRADSDPERRPPPSRAHPEPPTGSGPYKWWPTQPDLPVLSDDAATSDYPDLRRGPGDFETVALRLLGAGRLDDLRALLAAEGTPGDLVSELLRAEVDVRSMALEPLALQALIERVDREEPPGSRLRPWSRALLAECLLLSGEAAAFLVARQALEDLEQQPTTVLVPLPVRYARGRLARVESSAWLFAPTPDGLDYHQQRREQALADLLAGGFVSEVHLTRGMAAGLVATELCEDVHENYVRLLDARAAVGNDSRSVWPAMLDFYIAIVATDVGDIVAMFRALDRMEANPTGIRLIDMLPAFGRARFRMATQGPSPQTIRGVEQSLAGLRRHDPRAAQHWYSVIAHQLADMGSRWAGHFARLEAEFPPLGIMGQVDRELLRLRVAALAGKPVTAEDGMAVVGQLEAFGQTRKAARSAARLAHDLSRAGRVEEARPLHRWGRRHMPSIDRMTVVEIWWCRRLEHTHDLLPRRSVETPGEAARRPTVPRGPAPARTEPRLQLRVLAPTVEVEGSHGLVVLSDAQAKLMLALVVSHPSPLHVEQVSDLLWPEEELAATRSRLNSLVHRLRRALGGQGNALVRNGDLLQLDESRCQVDLWTWQRALGEAGEARSQALTSVRGLLGDAQFPYDEPFVEERHRIVGEWLRHAAAAREAGDVDSGRLLPALTALKLTPDDLEVARRR